MSDSFVDDELGRAGQVISARLGLNFPSARAKELRSALERVSHELKRPASEGLRWVLKNQFTAREIDVLARHLTVGETYFFREKPVFSGLEEGVFPALLRERRGSRELRIWSAGCCTGEEPYSLAILLERLILDRSTWNVSIRATDLNPDFLARAERGIYSEWSFRDVSPELRRTYFVERQPRSYELLPRLREQVTFSQLNLVEPSFPSPLNGMQNFDLILCRNVLMYFAPEQALEVIARLRASLTQGGYLVVSPTEISQTLFRDFRPVQFRDAVFYQRRDAGASQAAPIDLAIASRPSLPAAQRESVPPPKARPSVPSQASSQRISSPPGASSRVPADNAIFQLAEGARRAADNGRLEEALLLVDEALGQSRVDPLLHYLQATILTELGHAEAAARALRVALYLEPEFVLAHFELGHLCLKQGFLRQARRQFSNVLALLGSQPDGAVLPEAEGLTAGRLRELSRVELERVK